MSWGEWLTSIWPWLYGIPIAIIAVAFLWNERR